MATSSAPENETETRSTCNVFISYQWKTQSKVRLLYQELASREALNVFMDIFKIKAGMNLYLSLASNIQQADVILACVTRDYVKSKNCEREIIYADAFNKQIIPLYMEKIPMAELGSIGFILVRERYCNLYRNEKAFDNFSESDELKDILDGIKVSIAKQNLSIELDKKANLIIDLNEENTEVIQFRNDQPLQPIFQSAKNEQVAETHNATEQVAEKEKKSERKKSIKTLPRENKISEMKPAVVKPPKLPKFTNVFELHPIIKELKFLTTPKILLDPLGDRFYFEKVEKKRGNETYYPPNGWIRYGINIKSIYPDIDKWLAKDGNPDEWAVCYHGFKSNPLRSFLYYKLCDKEGKLNPHFENSNNMAYFKELDINPRSLGYNNQVGLGIFCSQSANKAEEHTAVFSLNDVRYKMLLQCRVNPQRIRVPKKDPSLYVINASHYIRPYGILIKEI